ncbi:hypothetical protein [Mesorhizobium amorphae]|nr:hypothetical protein [Mesorhizobium amorphae]
MTESVRQRLTESLATATSANKALATYMLANLAACPSRRRRHWPPRSA